MMIFNTLASIYNKSSINQFLKVLMISMLNPGRKLQLRNYELTFVDGAKQYA